MKTSTSLFATVLCLAMCTTYLHAEGVNEAGEKLSTGDYDAAITLYTSAIATTPQDGRLHVFLGEAYIAKGKALTGSGDAPGAITAYDSAIASLSTAIPLCSNPSTAYKGRGVAKQLKGDHAGAVADLTLALGQSVKYADAYYHRSISQKALGQDALAVADYNSLLKLSKARAALLAQLLGL
ncbi:MAG: tetratricopeptide repeat protein [Kiritimatiellae bacterium]|nr:tetratricopeptide repeat protein [Kiritimatiellia bacterium]